ncbi:MAG: phosphoenolpyruvate protein kinase [Candidatus Thermoplasmatota archaeon]|nr:phosphoenolpyruvate protein kinase [Candidatus Thermoplasmatota archaeon]
MGEEVVRLADSESRIATKVGGKAANLALLSAAGFPVPPGFVVTVDAYRSAIRPNGVSALISDSLRILDYKNESAVASCSEAIKERIMLSPLDPNLVETINTNLRLSGADSLWAVRSSATAEDLPQASFAGQQDTFLGVPGEEVPDRVKRCWASFWNARAISYRHKAGIDHMAHGIAVVIQRMVDAKCAGVLFTTDPVRNRKGIMVIESSWGLGESIVSGLVSPDRFECDKSTLSTIQRSIARKASSVTLTEGGRAEVQIEDAAQSEPSLTDGEIRALAEMGLRIEAHFGRPQDIEWAIEGDRMFVLQARPITSVVTEDETLWTRGYGDEYWADVTSPLFFSLLGEYLTKYVNHEGSRILGYKGIVGKELLRMHKGHIYFNSAVLEEVFSYNPRFSRTKELLNYFPERDQARIASEPAKLLPRLLSELRVAILDPDGMIIRTDKAYREWSERFMAEMRAFDAKDLSRLSYPELHEEFRRIECALLKHYRLIRYGMVTHSIGTNLMVKRWLSDWLGDRTGALYSNLVSGLGDNKTIETNIAIERLAKVARISPAVLQALVSKTPDAFLEELRIRPDLAGFAKAFDSFMAEYGHRSHTREMYFPRWSEDPRLIVDALKALVSSTRLSLEETEQKRYQERLDAEKGVLGRISKLRYGFLKRTVFKTVMRFAQTYLMFRENQRFYLDHQIVRWRRLFLEYGRRFAAGGIIRQQDDIFFLYKEEVFDIASGNLKADLETIEQRRREFERYRYTLPPKFLKGRLEFDDPVLHEGAITRISGTSASPGIVTGPVRVVDSIDNVSEVREGEILVTSNTDPGWTSVFAKIGGLVTETGGILSHGAVVSREYGIPAVTAVRNATAILRTGQKITLDGGEGLLLIHEGAMAEDTDIVHEFGEHPDWNESFYFNFYDRGNDICGFMRIGLKPNRDEKSMFFFLMMPDGSNIGKRKTGPFTDSEFKESGLRYEKISPGGKWRIGYDGDMTRFTGAMQEDVRVSMALDFEPLHPIFNYRECVTDERVEMSKMAASEHTEQYGRLAGRLQIGGKEFRIEAFGERDHSWGVRDWIAPTMWIWLTAQFSEDVAMNLTKLFVENGVVDAGYLHMDGQNVPIVKAEVETEYSPDGSPKALSMVLHDKRGGTHEMTAKVIRTVRLPFAGHEGYGFAVMYETLAQYEFDGLTGCGVAEYLVRQKR